MRWIIDQMSNHVWRATPCLKLKKRTTLHLSSTLADKVALKTMAAERDTTVSALIHEWIERQQSEKVK